MNHLRTAVITAIALTGFATGPAAAGEDAEVNRAKAELQRQLREAGADGHIAVKAGARQARLVPPPLRNADVGDCLTADMLNRSAKSLGANRAEALESLRRKLLSDSAFDQSIAEMAMARAYLVVGFVEEARAIAAAREGAEASGITALAYLADGDHLGAARAVALFASCGALYEFVDDAAKAVSGSGHRLSDRSLAMLSALPADLRRPIAEALAVGSLSTDEGEAAKYAALAKQAAFLPGSEAAAFLHAALGAPNKDAATAALATISASPGPLRQQAMRRLSDMLDDDVDAAVVAALDDSITDETGASPPTPALAALNISIANRRLKRRDFAGAARAFAVARRTEATRKTVDQTIAPLIKSLFSSSNADERLGALDFLAAAPELASALSDKILAGAVGAGFADLGAVDALTEILPHLRLGATDKTFLQARALVRAGRRGEAYALATPLAAEGRFAELIACCAIGADRTDLASKKTLARALTPEAYADYLWRGGEFEELSALPISSSASAAARERLAWAHIAARRPRTGSEIAAFAEAAGMKALFTPVPDPAADGQETLMRFAELLESELSFIRGALSDE